jgi:hypothetical protein
VKVRFEVCDCVGVLGFECGRWPVEVFKEQRFAVPVVIFLEPIVYFRLPCHLLVDFELVLHAVEVSCGQYALHVFLV